MNPARCARDQRQRRLRRRRQRGSRAARDRCACGCKDRGYPGGSVCGNGIQATSGSLRAGCRDRRATDRARGSLRHGAPGNRERGFRTRIARPDRVSGGRPSTLRHQWSSSTIRDMNQIRGRNPISPRHREDHTTISHPGSDVTCPGSNPSQRHTYLQRAAHPRSDRVRSSFREDRRVHTCGLEPTGALL
jgi:hypothetical protein